MHSDAAAKPRIRSADEKRGLNEMTEIGPAGRAWAEREDSNVPPPFDGAAAAFSVWR